ncbi:hypothetical protein [Ancylobacter polymorphus]|nr:hypothetical protein [Ancylobacter polymorphus]
MRRVMAWLLATWLLAWRDEPDVYDEVHGDVVIVPRRGAAHD